MQLKNPMPVVLSAPNQSAMMEKMAEANAVDSASKKAHQCPHHPRTLTPQWTLTPPPPHPLPAPPPRHLARETRDPPQWNQAPQMGDRDRTLTLPSTSGPADSW